MNCEQADALLIDLACGDLAGPEAAELRAHVETCEACGRSLARMETGRALARQLPRETPRPATTAAIMAAARAKAAELQSAAAAPATDEAPTPALVDEDRPPAAPEEGAWAALMRWMGSFAMGPQVAMAMLLMLMVGIGFLYLPTQGGESVARPAVDPDPDGLGGAGALEPADPLPLRVDPRTHRIVPDEGETGEELAVHRPARETHGDGVLPDGLTEVERAGRERAGAGEREGEIVASAGDVIEGDLDPALEGVLGSEELGAGEGIGRSVSGSMPEAASGVPDESGALALRVPTSPRAVELGPMAIDEGARAEPGLGRPSMPRAAASRPSSTPSAMDDVRPSPSEESAPAGAPDEALPIALHRQARSAMSANAWGSAARTLTDLLTRHPRYSDAPRAMLELAECERRLGHLSSAETWLTRAARSPSVAREAERQLARVRAERRASDHSFDSEMAAEPAEAH